MTPAQDLTNVRLDGRYLLTRLMGEGGMGQVYEGYHAALDRKVAVKVLLPRYAYEPKFRERFLREAKAASKVRHPNVVQILDFGDTPGGSVYFVMEFLEGRDLAAVLRQTGPLPWPRARHLLLQVLSALAAAHERKIIHRDIKPANFFIEELGGHHDLVKVLDFGIAKLAADAGAEESSLAQSLTGTGEVFGTAKYMAPEQAYGASNDVRVDVYSLGIVAYELLTGKVPFTGVSVFDIITRHVNERPRPPRELVPEIPLEVEAWILRAIAKQPDDRFASMVAMEQALLAITAGVSETLPVMAAQSVMAAQPVMAAPPVMPMQPVMAAQPVMPMSPAPMMPMPVQPVGDVLDTPMAPRMASSVPSRGPATSVIPTRVRVPSSVTSGELQGPAAPGTTTGSEDSGLGASTSRLQGAGDEAGATGPTEARGSSGHVADTDPHSRYTASRPAVSPQKLGLVLGMLGTLGGGLAVLVGYLVVVSSQDEPVEPAAVVEAVEPKEGGVKPPSSGAPTVTEPPTGEPGEVASGGSTAAPGVPSEPMPSAATPASDVEPASPPATPAKPKPSAKREPRPKSQPAPLTDGKVASQLARSLAKKCSALGPGTKVIVSVMVGSDGAVLSKSVRGATGALKDCLASGVAKAKFPTGKTRQVPVEVSL